MNWRTWFKGFSAAVIGGAASGITGYVGNVVINPDTVAKLDVGERFYVFGVIALFSGFFSGVLYLKQSPLPNGYGKLAIPTTPPLK